MIKRIVFLVPLSVIIVVVFQWALFLKVPLSNNTSSQIIEIASGATFLEVTDVLDRHGLIRSPFFFRLLGKMTDAETRIKPGEYRLQAGLLPEAVLQTLVAGKVILHKVVIPEGTSIQEIGAILEKAELVKEDIFVAAANDPGLMTTVGFDSPSLEGFLFPDTYYFSKQRSPQEIVQDMVAQFRVVYNSDFVAKATALGMTQNEVITLASIIEKETGRASERTTISGVFHNRLKRRMRLQSDPTVIYSLASFDGDIRKKDLLNESPYNTYRVKGLPPGPISNPGRESIFAALNPEAVDYLYFVSKNDGSHYFSETLPEHNRAVRKYQLNRQAQSGK